MNYISLKEIMDLSDNSEILVNRVRINLELVILNFQEPTPEVNEKKMILYKAIRNIMEQEKVSKCVSFGALMKIEDVKRVFDNINILPRNTFAKPRKISSDLNEIDVNAQEQNYSAPLYQKVNNKAKS